MNTFDLLLKEALFTNEMLCAGYTQVRKANFSQRGIYFQAFTSLSTGLERLGKLCVILIHVLKNNGKLPSYKDMKDYSHDILKLYKEIITFKNDNKISFSFLQDLDLTIYQNILSILSRFGCGDRYTNLDFLVNNITHEDPISVWFTTVDSVLFETKISERKKDKLRRDASLFGSLTKDNIFVSYTNEIGDLIETTFDTFYQSKKNNCIAPYRQLYVFHIMRFFVETLDALEDMIRERNFFDIPYFSEIFRNFFNEDAYIKTRKTLSPYK